LLNQQAFISYKKSGANEPSEYRIHLLGLVQRGPIIYLICKIEDSSKIYRLDLHRVKSAELLHESSAIPEKFDLDAYIAEGSLGFGE
ncbi:WYL domain-containing protein, partial [Acinetobacter baumannii]